MDVSSEYVKMCEKAEEIQEECVYYEEDIIAGLLAPPATVERIKRQGLIPHKGIWLPRQDELQEMLKAKNLTELIGAVYKWLKDNNYDQYYDDVTSNPYSSMEQIWLAFVMKERYGKIWADGDWVK